MAPVTGGGRSTRGPNVAVGEWTCPACGAKQQGQIHEGCEACGAGKPGRHIPPAPVASDPIAEQFTQWLGSLRGKVDVQMEQLLFEAFKSGYQLGIGTAAPVRPPEAPLSGTPESRTLVAALRLFIDQVLQFRPDEVESGEFLSAEEAERVITRISGGSR